MAFSYVNINGENVKQEADIKIKQYFLEKEGATVIKQSNGTLTIKGPFTISHQEEFDNSVLILGSLQNSGTINIKSGSLEDIFISPTPAQYTVPQTGKICNKPRP